MTTLKVRVAEIVCDVVHPVTGEVLMTEDTIKIALAHKTIKRFVYILHNQDTYNADDELKEINELKLEWSDGSSRAEGLKESEFIQKYQRIHAGNLKNAHYHIVVECPNKIDIEVLAKWFGVPSNFIHVPKGHGAFLDKVEYLTHEHEKQQALGKHLYSDDEMHANFDFRAELDNRALNRARYGAKADNMTDAQKMMMHVLQDGWTLRKCEADDPLTYASIRSKLPPLRLDYLMKQPAQPFRLSIYVDGKGGVGKGSICAYIAERLFPDEEIPYFCVGNDPRVAFDGYDGEPVLIWEDYRAYKFVSNFTREGTFAIFDTHPKTQSQQVKNSRVVLQNVVNIVNGVEPYADFLDGLAGEYKDKDGNLHIAEDKNQVYRRFQQIICIREEDFDILYNRGFLDKNSFYYKQYDMYAKVCGSMSKVMQRLEGSAKEHLLIDMSQPVVDCYHMLEESHNDKISKIEDIPEEFKDYGKVKTAEDIWNEELDRHIGDEIEQYLLLKEYSEVFTQLWISVNAEDLVRGVRTMNQMCSFEEWKQYGCPNTYDTKNKCFMRVENL